jgi:lipoic acid synthetase
MTIPSTRTAERLPPWFKTRLTTGRSFIKVQNSIRSGGLHTVCESAACPNRNECWNAGTATFLILGDVCTRNCGFCNVQHGRPGAPDSSEPERVARSVAELGLTYAVVTSVTRDDLPDGGAGIFAETIEAIRQRTPGVPVEVLIPDLQGSSEALNIVLNASPDVLNHNLETVPSLYPSVRPAADYQRSLRLLDTASKRGMTVKSGIILGLGEDLEEVHSVLRDLYRSGCRNVTIGQYLRPRRDLLPVVRYYEPSEFDLVRDLALSLGFFKVNAGPFVRSSYHADGAERAS